MGSGRKDGRMLEEVMEDNGKMMGKGGGGGGDDGEGWGRGRG